MKLRSAIVWSYLWKCLIFLLPSALLCGQSDSTKSLKTKISVFEEMVKRRDSLEIQKAKSFLLDSLEEGDTASLKSILGHKLMKLKSTTNAGLGDNVVYGFHPNWSSSTAWKSYNYGLLSHFSYFCYTINPATGSYSNIYDWSTTGAIDSALAAGCKVDLTLTTLNNGAKSSVFMNNATAVDTCIATCRRLLKQRGGNGICIDFEDLTPSDTASFNNFVKKLKAGLLQDNPNAEVNVAVYATLYSSGAPRFDLKTLNSTVDHFIIMGYDYSGSWSSTAGASAPLAGSWWKNLNVEKSIDDYITEGATPAKLVLAVPYYGNKWETDTQLWSSGSAETWKSTYTYRNLMNELKTNTYTAAWDTNSKTPYWHFKSGDAYYQIWVDNDSSLGLKYDLIKAKGLGGMGIWALGYDNGYTELWDLIETKFGGNTSTSGFSFDWGNMVASVGEMISSLSVQDIVLALIALAALILILAISLSAKKNRQEVINLFSLSYLIALAILTVFVTIFELFVTTSSTGFYSFLTILFVVALAIVAFLILVSHTIREQLLNAHSFFYVLSLGFISVMMLIYQFAETKLSSFFPRVVLLGVVVLLMGFLLGRWWERRMAKSD